jgi:hypothetical protein
MSEIDVQVRATGAGWRCAVTVREGSSESQHEVTLSQRAYADLTGGRTPPDALVREAFVFLLEREPKESILRRFDLMVIGRYFPEFETELRRRLEHCRR